jgi:hypothetical protein
VEYNLTMNTAVAVVAQERKAVTQRLLSPELEVLVQALMPTGLLQPLLDQVKPTAVAVVAVQINLLRALAV